MNSEHPVALLPYLTLDMTYIEDTVTAFCDQYQTELIQPSFRLTGERPTYNKVNNSHVEHQTLIITMGTPKSQLNPADVVRKILDGYSMLEMEQEYEAPIAIEPEHLSAQAIFDELCLLPQDAVIDSNTFAVTPEVYGYGFNVENVQRQIDRAEFGQTLQIKLGFLLPDITVSALNSNLFKDTLASYVSRCTDGTNNYRDQNLKQSCQAINGYILKVGESFDLDEVLGPRTYTRGYRHAPTYSGSTTTSFGGGINQTASTLYYCALMAGLTINERHSHRYAVGYTPLGTDASLSTYGAESLVFTNNTTAPIRILATANGSTVSITFLGTETRDQTWKVETEVKETVAPTTIYQYMDRDNVFNYVDGQIKQTSQIGYTIEVYMCKYDAVTGALLEKKLLTTTRYESRDQIVIKIIEDGQQIIT